MTQPTDPDAQCKSGVILMSQKPAASYQMYTHYRVGENYVCDYITNGEIKTTDYD